MSITTTYEINSKPDPRTLDGTSADDPQVLWRVTSVQFRSQRVPWAIGSVRQKVTLESYLDGMAAMLRFPWHWFFPKRK